jgi:hypothetical protein
MKVYTEIKEVQDLLELLDILFRLKKVRESIYTSPVDDFTVEVHTGIIKV